MQGLIFTAVYATFQLVFREKPEHPPSAVAEAAVQNLNFGDALSLIKKNTSFTLLLVCFAMMFGFYISLGNLISSIFAPFGFSPSEIAQLGLYLLVAGIIGAVIIGAWVDRTGTYKVSTIVIVAANMLFLTSTNWTIYHLEFSKALFMTSTILMGFASVSFIPLALGFAAELTFPL